MVHNSILIITAVYPPEPVVSSHLSADLYHALKAKGREVRVLHPKPTRPNGFCFGEIKPGTDEVVSDSFTCPQSSMMGRVRESISFGKACSDYINEHHEEISLIYANAWPMGAQYQLVKAAKKHGIPVAMHIQDVYPESLTNKMPSFIGGILRSLILPIDKYILKNSNRVIAISEKMKNYLVMTRGIDAGKVSVVINWQDETEFLEYQKLVVYGEHHDKFTFMYMGNIGPVAGVDLLIDAFSLAKIENSRLVIAGSGSMKEMLIEKAKHNQEIEFWDVSNGKVPEIQSKADVMMLPIKKGAASSSIPSKLPAYMFSAKPIIGAMDEDSDTADAIKEANCGVVIEPENAKALSAIMREMAAKDREELKIMGLKGQEYALARFSKGANLKNLIEAISELL